MDDRELLELAARAAGIRYDKEASKPHPTSGAFFGLWLQIDGEPYEGQRRRWNPLTDDADAFRLAVKLGIKVMPYPVYSPDKHSIEASRLALAPPTDDENTYVGPQLVERYGDDPYAATRRAITRAAAEIGKDMQEKTPPA